MTRKSLVLDGVVFGYLILVVAWLVAPASILTPFNLKAWSIIAAGASILASCGGVYVSFFLNGSTGPCIVLCQAALFVFALVFAPKYGSFSRNKLMPQN